MFLGPPLAPRRCDHADQQCGDDHARESQEQEEHLGVDGVGSGSVELRSEIVANLAGTGEGGLEVPSARLDLREGDAWIGG